MADVMTALSTAITPTTLWAQIAPAATFIGGMAIFAFGYHVVRKTIKSAGKGKVNA